MKPKTSTPIKAKKSATPQPPAKQQSKQSQIVELLKKKTGTTVEVRIPVMLTNQSSNVTN